MAYEVINNADETIIQDHELKLKVRVTQGIGTEGTAFCLGTLYAEKSSYIPSKTYTFQIISDDPNAEEIKKLAIFFFASLLDTELYIIEIPRNSALFPQEAQRIFGNNNYERAV